MIEGTIAIFSITGRVAGKITDQRVTQDVQAGHHVAADAGEWRKTLFPESACGENNSFTRFNKAISQASKWHYDHSFPWKKGEALVMADFMETYDRVANGENRSLVQAAAAEFWADMEHLINRARLAHNGTFRDEDYAKVRKSRESFCYNEVKYAPVSEGSQFAKGIEAGLRRKLEAELETANAGRISTIQAEAWRRLLNPMEEFAARIQNPDFKPKSDSMNYIRSVLGLLPAMQGADPVLVDATERIKDVLNTVNADDLKYTSAKAEATAGLNAVVSTFSLRRKFSTAEEAARATVLAQASGASPKGSVPTIDTDQTAFSLNETGVRGLMATAA